MMKCLRAIFSLCLLNIVWVTNTLAQPEELSACNVVWTTPSENAAGSMPCGGGDIGLNVWVENGDVLFYLSRSGTFDENNAMLKLGRVRLKLLPNPFHDADFKQTLVLKEGNIRISGGSTQLTIWVDVFRPVVHVDIQSAKPISILAAYESWRHEDHLITETSEFRANAYKVPQQFDVKTYRDEVAFHDNEVIFYHRNRSDIENAFDYTVRMQSMEQVKDKMYNPIANNTFGGMMKGKHLKAAGTGSGQYADVTFKSWMLESKTPVRTEHIQIGLHVDQTPTLAQWHEDLRRIMDDADQNNKTALQKTKAWWQQYWNRSYIFIDGPDSSVRAVSLNYQRFRYQLGCNAYGKWPTKFNGGLFTFDPGYVDPKSPYSPDFRRWGGGTMTAQNQRLVYLPMLKSGDFDMLKSQFDFYLRTQKNAELRSQVYWNHQGACFTEQIENFGLPNIMEYGQKRPKDYDPGMEYNAWLEYQWETVFEFCLMMLETERYENRDITPYIPFIESCLTFYDEHYQMLAKQRGVKPFNEAGQYILYPTSACETYKMTYNSATVIAALQVILNRMLALPQKYLTDTQREKCTTMLKRVPPLPFQEYNGHKTLAPALTWARVQNSEAPQLYPVYPWGLYGVGKPDLEVAINTWKHDPHVVKYKSHVGWRQHNIFAARLGLAEEAAELTKLKFKNAEHRFPTFWGPGFDWTPDHNWGGSAMIGLQEMLMQVDDRKIYLLPAWPTNWNATFKLHAPYNTTVEAVVKNGKIEKLTVTPPERSKDITIMN